VVSGRRKAVTAHLKFDRRKLVNSPTSNALAVRQEFGGTSMSLAVAETSSAAVAAQAKAMVEARYIMAMQRPRDWDQVRQNLMKECRRPSFAHNKSAYYRKPIGQGVEGLGIRFVEVALRCMTNVLVETSMIFEDTSKEVHRVACFENGRTQQADG
jgi:hypothetical protein